MLHSQNEGRVRRLSSTLPTPYTRRRRSDPPNEIAPAELGQDLRVVDLIAPEAGAPPFARRAQRSSVCTRSGLPRVALTTWNVDSFCFCLLFCARVGGLFGARRGEPCESGLWGCPMHRRDTESTPGLLATCRPPLDVAKLRLIPQPIECPGLHGLRSHVAILWNLG